MPYITINGARLYYETFGQDKPDQAPVLLIHSSPVTGREDWSLVAPLLARRWRVIVPDCRGHGQSNNPYLSYSFKELAADMAALVRALGYERAHIVGHSNGGNVALVVLMEHPDVVQTAVLQAANAYVSPDLVEKEPPIFDPDRVAREDPAWMEKMIGLHGPTNGPEYWRDLLRLTVQEIITEPNYTSEDLRRVERPVLVIQGENDRVNAPARHAQFIAGHIPQAELWIPANVGHNVHLEVLFEWIERISDFLDKRGEGANETLYRLRCQRFADERTTIFDVHAQSEPEKVPLSGMVLTAEQRQAALESIPSATTDQIHVLLDESTPWALVNRNVNDLRREPRSLAERTSQVIMGEAVRILEEGDEWARVRTERNGYLGWMRLGALHRCNQQDVQAYQATCQVQVISELLSASLTVNLQDYAGKIPFGVRLPVETWQSAQAQIRLPDGRLWWVDRAGLSLIESGPRPDADGIAFTLNLMRRFVGVPYLWGGRTPFGFDCSGFAQAFWDFMGVNIPRDADQQFRAAVPIQGAPQPGDLLFFGEQSPELNSNLQGDRYACISHVAISLGDDEIIHANGSAWGVSYNSLNPASPIYRAWLRDNLVGVGRFGN